MAATVEFGTDAKQELLELRSENARLRLLAMLSAPPSSAWSSSSARRPTRSPTARCASGRAPTFTVARRRPRRTSASQLDPVAALDLTAGGGSPHTRCVHFQHEERRWRRTEGWTRSCPRSAPILRRRARSSGTPSRRAGAARGAWRRAPGVLRVSPRASTSWSRQLLRGTAGALALQQRTAPPSLTTIVSRAPGRAPCAAPRTGRIRARAEPACGNERAERAARQRGVHPRDARRLSPTPYPGARTASGLTRSPPPPRAWDHPPRSDADPAAAPPAHPRRRGSARRSRPPVDSRTASRLCSVDPRLGEQHAVLEVHARGLHRLARVAGRGRPRRRSSAAARSGCGLSRRCRAPARRPPRASPLREPSCSASCARPDACESRTGSDPARPSRC